MAVYIVVADNGTVSDQVNRVVVAPPGQSEVVAYMVAAALKGDFITGADDEEVQLFIKEYAEGEGVLAPISFSTYDVDINPGKDDVCVSRGTSRDPDRC